MNIHLPVILMLTRGTAFWSIPKYIEIYNLSPVLSNLLRLPGNVHCVLGHQNHLHICCPVLGFTGIGARQCCPYCLVPLMWLVGSLKEWKVAWWFEYAKESCSIYLSAHLWTWYHLVPLAFSSFQYQDLFEVSIRLWKGLRTLYHIIPTTIVTYHYSWLVVTIVPSFILENSPQIAA